MQMCPECGYYYDESEYAKCPECYGYVPEVEPYVTVTDPKTGEVIEVPKSKAGKYQ